MKVPTTMIFEQSFNKIGLSEDRGSPISHLTEKKFMKVFSKFLKPKQYFQIHHKKGISLNTKIS